MSFGLGRGRTLDPGAIGVSERELPPMPDGPPADGAPPESAPPDRAPPDRAPAEGAPSEGAPAGAALLRGARIDPRAWFPNPERPFEIEVGSGKGTFLLQQAEVSPETNYLGIEWAGEFYAYAADRIRRRGLTNVRMLRADATDYLRWRVPDGVARVIHLYFSDPWPKARHHKRRVVQDRFLADARRVLSSDGELRIVTDHDDYWSWMEEHFARWSPASGTGPFLRLPFERPASAGVGEVVGTNFERKYAREGRPFHATILRKGPGANHPNG